MFVAYAHFLIFFIFSFFFLIEMDGKGQDFKAIKA